MLYKTINKYTFIASLLLLLALVGCKESYNSNIGPDNNSDKAYLRISFSGISLPNDVATRAQGEEPSIQTDGKDYEDYVNNLAVLVYDASTEKIVKVHFTTYKSFILELEETIGKKYHFCFIANFPKSWEETLRGLPKYNDLKQALQEPKIFKSRDGGDELYKGATADSFFPMARIFEDQTVQKGGSITNPIPFNPITDGTGSLKPISNWKESKETGTVQKTVNLVRTAAKISLKASGEGLHEIKKIELINAVTEFSYMESSKSPKTLKDPLVFKDSDKISSELDEYESKLYIPENLLGEGSTELGWDIDNDKPVGAPTYIQITMGSGMQYKIPIIVNDPSEYIAKNSVYIDFARNNIQGLTADYSIVRNNHYEFDIIVPADNKELDIKLKVMPWTLVPSVKDFTHPKYELKITKNDVTVLQDISSEIELRDRYTQGDDITLSTVSFEFKINAPIGALWSATITNGRYFVLQGETAGIITQENSDKTYKFMLKPREKFSKTPRYTEFYILVDNKEIHLEFDDDGTVKNEYVSDASQSQRWKFIQLKPL